jgi:DNA-binding transcriptional ArsR family regulator
LAVTSTSAARDDATVDATLAALADPVRRRSVELLAEQPRRAGELAAAVGVSAPVMSRHLRVLRDAALVEEEHPPFDARVRIYSLRAARMVELRSWLTDTEAGWSQQLAALKEHLERA